MNQAVMAVNFIIGALFTACFAYQGVYYVLALVRKEKPHTAPEKIHRFAVLISARNEENVIGHLLESIAGQDYPADMIETFVIADNCADGTAARGKGPDHVGEGAAAQEGEGLAFVHPQAVRADGEEQHQRGDCQGQQRQEFFPVTCFHGIRSRC